MAIRGAWGEVLRILCLFAFLAGLGQASSIPLTLLYPHGKAPDNGEAADVQSSAINDGFAALTRHDYDAAIADFTDAIRSGYRPEVGYVERATAYENKGDHEQAIADCSEVLKLDPKFGTAWVIRGTFEYMTHDYAHAIDDETEALRLTGGNDDMAYYERGINYVADGDYDKAIADLNHIIDRDPAANPPTPPNEDTSSKYGLVALDADGFKSNYFRGFAYLKKGELDKADDDFTAALKTNPNNLDALLKRGATRMRRGQRDAAMADLDNAVALAPQNAEVYNERGAALLDVHDFKAAAADFTNALQIDPRHAGALNNLGLAFMGSGDADRAIDAYSRALEIDPSLAIACVNRANALLAKGRVEDAVADLDQAHTLQPKNAGMAANLALARAKMGDFAKAIAGLEDAITLDPGLGGTYNNLAWLLATCPDAKFRDGKRALEAATMACKFTSWADPVTLDTFAAACAESGDFDAAVKWEQAAITQPGLAPNDVADAKKRLVLYQSHKTYQEDPRPPSPAVPPATNGK